MRHRSLVQKRRRRSSNCGGVAFRPAPVWSLAAAWQIHSGWPTTARSFSAGATITGEAYAIGTTGPLNAEHLPPYHRLDLRIARTFRVGGGRLTAYVDVYNLYDRENPKSYDYLIRGIAGRQVLTMREYNTMIGILPSIGLRWEF